ncbi:uncharacterized protein EI90DRAFT_2964452 [Cantharellus anzutake]|uniref:uncharacterized protein n=1 Tax=Cantharellus anzutake TaxID=1750568 RepID=UPI001907D73E|nr:uncharacterized protein EI90DRAFT_2964452 [Cantharellus anzutake]KAF8342707.1 hypothetical protein EI90DRAFT_2964452 [Cantharellus anzutake]
MALYLCIDCGGTKAAAVVANTKGDILGRGTGGPANFKDAEFAIFSSSVRTAVDSALAAIEPTHTQKLSLSYPDCLFKAAWIGAAGVDRPQDILDLTPFFSKLLSIPAGSRLIIENDTTLLASPIYKFPEVRTAIIAISGTGCIATAFRLGESGHLQRVSRAGGWGWILGDEGSGYHIGREALRRILGNSDHEQASPPSSACVKPVGSPTLQHRIFEHFGISSGPDILTVVYAPDPPYNSYSRAHPTSPRPFYLEMERKARVSTLTPIVFQSALSDGDPTALDILRTSSFHTARLITQNLAPIVEGGPEASDSILCFGGSLVGVKGFRDMVIDHLKDQGHVFKHVEFVGDGAGSGVLRLLTLFENSPDGVTS